MSDIDKPLAKTFDDDTEIEVEILSPPTSTGLCKVRCGERLLVRNKVQLVPLNDAARTMLKNTITRKIGM